MSWDQYFAKHKGRRPHPFYLKAVESIGENKAPKRAIDIGSGAGIESADLLKRGWQVLAIDREPGAKVALDELLDPSIAGQLAFWQKGFEELDSLPPAQFIYAYHTLPFCEAGRLHSVWNLIRQAVIPGGYFAGSFFGMNDEWVQTGKVTGMDRSRLESSLKDFKILHWQEIDQVGPTALQGDKHWHVLEVIAQKNQP